MTDKANDQFLERVRESLDDRSQQIRPQMSSRLRAVRSQAIESRQKNIYRGWVPAMAGAFAVVMAVGLWFGNTNNGQGLPQAQPVEQLVYEKRPADIEMLAVANGNGLELFQQYEFYTWLEKQERRSS